MSNRTTLCAIVKNEKSYLLEWIAYHRLLGFDQLVIYSNDCTDGSDELLDALARAKVIDHRLWPSVEGQAPQRAAYNDAVRRCGTPWICFLDADEFLVLKDDLKIQDFLQRFPSQVSAVAFNWRVFGSAGHVTREGGLVIERFTRAAPRRNHINQHCKTVARTADIREVHVHSCDLQRGDYADTSGRPIRIERLGFTPSVEHGFAQVNHYVVKSQQEFRDKQERGNANRPPSSPDKYSGRRGNYFEHHDRNEELDEVLLPMVLRVQADMERLQTLIDNHVPGLVA